MSTEQHFYPHDPAHIPFAEVVALPDERRIDLYLLRGARLTRTEAQRLIVALQGALQVPKPAAQPPPAALQTLILVALNVSPDQRSIEVACALGLCRYRVQTAIKALSRRGAIVHTGSPRRWRVAS